MLKLSKADRRNAMPKSQETPKKQQNNANKAEKKALKDQN
jgi:hypothetical protein